MLLRERRLDSQRLRARRRVTFSPNKLAGKQFSVSFYFYTRARTHVHDYRSSQTLISRRWGEGGKKMSHQRCFHVSCFISSTAPECEHGKRRGLFVFPFVPPPPPGDADLKPLTL